MSNVKVVLYSWPASQNHLECINCALIEPSEDCNQDIVIPACICLLNLDNEGEGDCSKFEDIDEGRETGMVDDAPYLRGREPEQ